MLIQITNILGEIVFSKDLTVQGKLSEEIDISDLAKGVYLLQLSDNKTMITEKIVIE